MSTYYVLGTGYRDKKTGTAIPVCPLQTVSHTEAQEVAASPPRLSLLKERGTLNRHGFEAPRDGSETTEHKPRLHTKRHSTLSSFQHKGVDVEYWGAPGEPGIQHRRGRKTDRQNALC